MTQAWTASKADSRRERWVLSTMLVASVVFHLASFAVLPLVADAGARVAGPDTIELQVVPAEPEPQPEPEPEPEAEAAPIEPPPEPPPPTPVRRAAPPPEAPEPAPDPAPAEETPVDFSGVTLTNDQGSGGWASAVGNGQDMQGPIGPAGQTTGRRRTGALDGAPGGTGTGPALVSPADLSKAPTAPPSINDLLERYYPRDAKEQGLEGVARVRIRIGPTGSVRVLRRQSERPTGHGFLDACAAMLRASPAWSAPLDRNGVPVATSDTFTCNFRVRY